MKVEFDNLTLVESKMLHDCLVQFRAGQPFAWPAGQWKQVESENGRVSASRVVDALKEKK